MRSLLFVPGHIQKYFEKARATEASAVIFDLEDAVPSEARDEARMNLKLFMSSGKTPTKVIVRVNNFGTEDFFKDVEVLHDCTGLMLMPTKCQDAAELIKIHETLPFHQVPLIETASSLRSAREILDLDFVQSVALGAEDLMDDLGVRVTGYDKMLDFVRLSLAVDGRAAGKDCWDTPFLGLDDLEGFASDCRYSYGIGYKGRLCIHPSQISSCNRYYYPTEEEQAFALEVRRKLDQAKSSGYNVIRWKGQLVGPPMIKRALTIIDEMEQC